MEGVHERSQRDAAAECRAQTLSGVASTSKSTGCEGQQDSPRLGHGVRLQQRPRPKTGAGGALLVPSDVDLLLVPERRRWYRRWWGRHKIHPRVGTRLGAGRKAVCASIPFIW